MFGSSGLKDAPSPLVMPVLSPGKHRNPRKGACFMEFASYLAGENWSDRPECTHSALAELARAVNDHIGDETRQGILPLVPEVIGLNGPEPLIDVMIARECALTALPVVPLGRARVVALGLLRCEKAMAEWEGRPTRELSERTRKALESQRLAYSWAVDFCQGSLSAKTFHGISSAAVIDYAVLGISEAAIDNPDEMLVELLRSVIGLCRTWFGEAEMEAATATAPTEPVPH
ncbi:MAG TPA: hypothetical protein VLI04_17465 [Nocardioidaceae bacterium]|nr:hypothetical protein [Nocardioidaceae bacterium]